MTLKTVIQDKKDLINSKLENVKLTNNWTSAWTETPTYFDFQQQIISLLDLSVKSNNFTKLDELTAEDTLVLKEKVLTLLSLCLNFSDLMNYDFEDWLEDEN